MFRNGSLGAAQVANSSEAAPTILVNSHGDPEAASTTPEVVTGTTTGTVTSVSWMSTSSPDPTACSTGAGTFSCSVTQAMDSPASQSLTFTASGPGGTGSDTTDLLFPAFQLLAGSTTPNDLPTTLTVNGTALDLVISCNATAAGMTCTPDAVAEAGAGTSPVTTINTPFHALDSAERGNTSTLNQKYYDSATAGVLTTEDFVVAAVVRHKYDGAGGDDFVVSKRLASGVFTGWSLGASTTTAWLGAVDVGATNVNVTSSAISTGSDYMVYWFGDRNEASTNGSVVYANGVAGTGVNISTVAATVATTDPFRVGSWSIAGSYINDKIYSLRVFKCPAGNPQCFAGGAGGATEQAAIARDWTAITFGMQPTLAAGIDSPTTMTRASTAYTDVVDGTARHLYNVGNAAPRTSIRTASSVAVRGYLSEPATTNLALQSQTLGTTWTAIDVGDNVLADAFAGADLSVTGDSIDGDDTGASEHGLRQAITLTATTHTFSAWAPRAVEQPFVALRNSTIANGTAWFSLDACDACAVGEDCAGAVGTVQAGVSQATASRWPLDTTGDGVVDVELCRVAIVYVGTVAAHNHDLLCAPSDGVTSYTDTGVAADCGFWGVEVEAFPTPTSYQITTTASVTRSADDLRFDGASHFTGSPTTMDVRALCPSFDVGTSSTLVSVGTGTTNYGRIGINSTSDRPHTDGANAGAQWDFSGASGDVADGATHKLRDTWVTNDVEGFYDLASYGTDVVNTLPTSAASFIYLGTRGSTAQQPACLLTNLRLWSRDVSTTEAP